MKDKKRIIFNFVFFILLIAVTYYLIFRKQNMSELIDNLRNVDPYFIAISFICMILFYLFEALNVNNLLRAFGEKYSFFRSVNSTLIGAFYSSITPASSGGEPMQAYYMSKDNIKISHSALALLIQSKIRGMGFALTCDALKELGYIDSDISDPLTRNKFSDDMVIIISNHDNSYSYTVCDGSVSCDNVSIYGE